MDQKMKAAFEAWGKNWAETRSGFDLPTPFDYVEWTLDYLRSQQEPICYVPEPVIHGVKERGKYAAVLFDYPATNGLDVPLYAHPIPSAPAVPEWQPIETAPKDRMILLAGVMDHESDWRIKVGYYDPLDGWKIFGASWFPLRWMPLPAAPSPEKKENPHD